MKDKEQKTSVRDKLILKSFVVALAILVKGLEKRLKEDYAVQSEDFKSGYSEAIANIKQTMEEINKNGKINKTKN